MNQCIYIVVIYNTVIIINSILVKHFIQTMSMSKRVFLFLLLSFHGVYSTFSSLCTDSTLCNGVKIIYPFWTVQEPESGKAAPNLFCGFKGFGLRCSSDNETSPIITLPGNDTYYVKDINYEKKSITLVGVEVSSQPCPRVRRNVTVDTLPLQFQPEDSLNLTFYFNCSPEMEGLLSYSCLNTVGSANGSYVFMEGPEVPAAFDWMTWCEDKVMATVKKTEPPISNLVEGYAAAIKAGFVLDWDVAEDCRGCVSSGGRCGFNNRTEQLVCFCENEEILTDVGRFCIDGMSIQTFIVLF